MMRLDVLLSARGAIGCFLLGLLGAAACAATGDPTTFGAGGAGQSSTSVGVGGIGVGGGDISVGAGGNDGGTPSACKVQDPNMDNSLPACTDKAPANSFSPMVQWTWTGPPAAPGALITGSFVTPLVGNFTDDNKDGAIDLCDIPDILITSIDTFTFGGGSQTITATANMFLLAGDTGKEEVQFQGKVDALVYPAFGDIDGDGLPEVLTADPQGHLVAYKHDGSLLWTGDLAGYRTTFASGECSTIGIYDLDGDGNPEILFGWEVFDNKGHKLWGDPTNAAEWDMQYWCVTPTAADLDGDGKLEVIFGHEAYHHDGTLYWKLPNFPPAHPHVANLDSDPEPEIFLTNMNGITVVEHDGKIKFGPVRPTDPNPAPQCWGKPAVVHDFDGDGKADLGVATCTDYTVYTVNDKGVTPKWTNKMVHDISGLATATGFDFLGSGVAQAIYADETQIYVFDGLTGKIDLTAPRTSGTLIEYPIVADVDNDGSAEIAYVSNYQQGMPTGPALTVLRDAMDRWIPARRIWNQYSYHVTNVREDGTIPKKMKNSWQLLNTFRTNSQIGKGGDCNPIPK